MTRSFLVGAALAALFVTAPQTSQAATVGSLGRAAPAQSVDFSVHLPLRNAAELDQLIEVQSNPNSPFYHHFLTVAQFRARFGPAPETMARAIASLRARGFSVLEASSQTLRVRGSAAHVEAAFQTRLGIVRDARSGATHVAANAAMTVPADLASVGATLIGLSPRATMQVHSVRVNPANRRGDFGGYYFDDLKQAYTYPSNRDFDGKGVTVGVMMASDVLDSDTQSELDHEKYTAISGKPLLPLVRRPVLGGAPFGGINNGASDEASIDVQTSLGSAPGAQIVLYNIPTLADDAVIAGYTDVVEDNRVDVLSSSFGGCELFYTPPYAGTPVAGVPAVLTAESAIFKQGNAQGITFLASSGDSAGLGCLNVAYAAGKPDGRFIAGVETPAADPNVTAVGGTNLETTTPPNPQPVPPILTSKYVSENEFGDPEVPYDPYGIGNVASGGFWGSGGGTSTIYPKPSYQNLVNTGARLRSLPDVSMQMGGCPGGIAVLPCHPGESFGIYFIGGSQFGFIGTSLSSPEFAGLLALRIEFTKSRLGNVNPYIYQLAAANGTSPIPFYHQGIAGFNGVVGVPAGRKGYNPIVGVGTPYAQNFLGVPKDPLSGNPQTITNP